MDSFVIMEIIECQVMEICLFIKQVGGFIYMGGYLN